jgi:hypothetical protein
LESDGAEDFSKSLPATHKSRGVHKALNGSVPQLVAEGIQAAIRYGADPY